MKNIIDVEEEIKKYNIENLPPELFKKAKEMRFSDRYIAEILNCKEEEIRNLRKKLNLIPVYKMVDTCAAEFEAKTPYYYSTYEKEDEVKIEKDKKAIVIGGGPIRIGQGIEFDYCCVHCIFALRENGYKAIIVNNNPETVSTDFDISDKLYFEPITLEEVLNILLKENPDGVILQFGGQTPLNLSAGIAKEGINILGTSQEGIDIAENRDRFEKLLKELNIKRPPGKGVTSLEEAIKIAEEIGYPVLVRPSYVLGGRAMEIVYNREELLTYMHLAIEVNPEHPVLVDKYLKGKEVEVDALGSGDEVFIPGIMEHIERAGVHSGDSISVVPPQNLSKKIIREIANCTKKIGKALNIKGLFNIQYVVHEENLYVLEVNPRASRTVPYLSKVIGLPLVKIATKVMLGETLKELGFKEGIYPAPSVVGIKVPIFSYLKLTELDIGLGPEMKSTGEIMGIDYNFSHALLKAFISANLFVSDNKNLLVTIADFDKEDSLPIIYEFYKRGYKIYATEGTANFLEKNGIKVTKVKKLHQGSPNSLDLIMGGKIGLLINTISSDKVAEKDGAKIRRAAVEFNIPCITSLDTANALIYSISATQNKKYLEYLRVHPLNEFLRK
jgi:carbamoyl-phosphate synthase large subunit